LKPDFRKAVESEEEESNQELEFGNRSQKSEDQFSKNRSLI
jgi:hypothetical protein